MISRSIDSGVDEDLDKYSVESIETNDWRKTEGEIVLDTDYLGSCVAIGVYNPSKGKGYLCHFPSLGNGQLEEYLEEFTDEVNQMFTDNIYVLAGGTMSPGLNPAGETPDIREARRTVEEVLSFNFESEFICDWHDGYNQSRMMVHPDEGILYEGEWN